MKTAAWVVRVTRHETHNPNKSPMTLLFGVRIARSKCKTADEVFFASRCAINDRRLMLKLSDQRKDVLWVLVG